MNEPKVAVQDDAPFEFHRVGREVGRVFERWQREQTRQELQPDEPSVAPIRIRRSQVIDSER